MKVLLQNIRSCHNVGSVFRTADAVGVDEILLGGYTPNPIDKYKDYNKGIAKVALGAEKSVKFRRVHRPGNFLDQEKARGKKIIALEIIDSAINYSQFKLNKGELSNVILLLGNEKRGLSKQVLEKVDVILKIPMLGLKESLNVSVAFAIVAFYLRDNAGS
jgi:tRNA G18 (ribose-2'-O)-methylase SpoU